MDFPGCSRPAAAVAGGGHDKLVLRRPHVTYAHFPVLPRGKFIVIDEFRIAGEAGDAFRVGPVPFGGQRAVKDLSVDRVGFIHPEDLAKEIKDALNLNPEIANSIADEIDRKIFNPIRTDLEKIYSPAEALAK